MISEPSVVLWVELSWSHPWNYWGEHMWLVLVLTCAIVPGTKGKQLAFRVERDLVLVSRNVDALSVQVLTPDVLAFSDLFVVAWISDNFACGPSCVRKIRG